MSSSRRRLLPVLFLSTCSANPCGLWQQPAQLHYLDGLKGPNGDKFGYVCVSRCGSNLHDPVCPNTAGPAASCLLEDDSSTGNEYCISTCISAQDCDSSGVNARSYRCVHGTPGSSGFRGICVHEANFKEMPGLGEMKKLNFMSQSKLVQQALHPSRVGTVVRDPGAADTEQDGAKQRLQTLAAANAALDALGRRYGMTGDHDYQALKKHLTDLGKGRSAQSSPPLFDPPNIGDSLANGVKGAVRTMLHPLESVKSALGGVPAVTTQPHSQAQAPRPELSTGFTQAPHHAGGFIYTVQVIVVMFFFYLLLGYVYQCHVNGASGIEALPHKDILVAIPASLARAFTFVRNLISASIGGHGSFGAKGSTRDTFENFEPL
ncbi:hypothetical protein FOZ62_022326 [Perkinsus olseni]|uniref:Uncharacterized protein n=2 Tax=Perkinsus olseni TaxID=32597 RepID=A0A7J6U357_PEROL|nr:hypothetical protein FOZ62_022326 [Perkinsus olseni]